MDQVKAFARAAAKHVFWIGCGLILAGSMASWYLARKTLSDEFKKNQDAIKSKFTAVKGLEGKKNPPNPKSHDEMDKLVNNTLKLVLEAWQWQYSQQDAILRWPVELKEDFITAVRPLKPIEAKVDFPTPANQELMVDFRRRYAGYVGKLLPYLADVVGTTWQVGRNPTGGMMGMGGNTLTPEEMQKLAQQKPPIVLWDPSDQSRLVATHFDWSNQPDQSPTTLQVLYAQEDLWVLTALMHIIRITNGQIESRHEAVVKNIETILIGRHAPPRAGQVARLGGGAMGSGGMMGGMGEMGGMSGYNPSGSEGSAMPAGMPSGAAMPAPMPGGASDMGSAGGDMGGMMPGMARVSPDPGEGRYVDNQYQALKAETLRSALRSPTPEQAFLVVAKRMPVRMRLIVDERKLPRLLANLGNAMLPVEVRQVRINRSKDAGGGYDIMGGGGGYGAMMGGGGYGGMMGGASDMGSGYGAMMGGMTPGSPAGMGMAPGMGGYGDMPGMSGPSYASPGYGGGSSGGYNMPGMGMPGQGQNAQNRTNIEATSKHDVPVEIYGIIYVYNPVDEKKLGLDQQPGLTNVVPPTSTPAT